MDIFCDRKLMLHHWYVKRDSEELGASVRAYGIVSGHPRFVDTEFIHTSSIQNVQLDMEHETAIIATRNSVYHCPLIYCHWDEQDQCPDLLQDYETLKARCKERVPYPTIDEDQVLLVLSNFDEYYFHSVYYRPRGAETPLLYDAHPHVGMFKDSFLIFGQGAKIDLRYFPHFENIEFYAERTDGKPFFLENIGDIELYAKTSKGIIRLNPGERKLVSEENAQKDDPFLLGGDLYPAKFMT